MPRPRGKIQWILPRAVDPWWRHNYPRFVDPVFEETDLKSLIKAPADRLNRQQRNIQKQARLSYVDRWLRSCLPERVVKRMASTHFSVAEAAATKLVKDVYREWAIAAFEVEREPLEVRRHRDRLRIEAVVAAAMDGNKRDLAAALRGLELLCRINGTLRADKIDISIEGVPREVIAVRSMSEEELLDIARGKVIDVTPERQALAQPS